MDVIANPEDRGDGIEQPACARSERRVQSSSRQPNDRLPALLMPANDIERLGNRVGISGSQVRRRHPPRLTDRLRTARERKRLEVADALEPGEIGDEKLAAPERAVGAEAETVERDTDRGTRF